MVARFFLCEGNVEQLLFFLRPALFAKNEKTKK
jgi:hypothetical protein